VAKLAATLGKPDPVGPASSFAEWIGLGERQAQRLQVAAPDFTDGLSNDRRCPISPGQLSHPGLT